MEDALAEDDVEITEVGPEQEQMKQEDHHMKIFGPELG